MPKDYLEDSEIVPGQLGTGSVSFSLHARTVTKAERDRWKKEDAERDKRRIPLGFR